MFRRLRVFFLILLSAFLLVLPFNYSQFGFLALVALIPYFFAIDNKPSSQAFKISFLFGCLFYSFLGYWLSYVNILGFILMIIYLSFYFAVFGGLAASFLNPADRILKNNSRYAVRSVIFVAAFWVILEYIRGWMISGMPWALLAYSQWKNVVLIQIADVTGAYGVSFFVILVNLLIFKLLQAIFLKPLDSDLWSFEMVKGRLIAALSVILIIVLVLVSGYGVWSLEKRGAFYKASGPKAKLRVAAVQGNIPQDQKWNAKIKSIIFEKYKRLTFMSALERSDLIVWPETSFPGYLEDEPILSSQLRNIVRESRTDVLVGAPTLGALENGYRFYNSAVLFGPDGEEKKRYSKVHLVPFGEYIPFEPVLGFIRNIYPIGHFSHGTEKTVFEITSRYQEQKIKARFSVLICYEDIFPGLVRSFVKNGADFLINMTNDAWFGKTAAPYQHAQASIFRAVENRVNVVRSTNTGFSCFISPEGRILDRVEDHGEEIFVTGHKSHDITLRKGMSFYTKFGDIFILLLFGIAYLAYRDKSRRRNYAQL